MPDKAGFEFSSMDVCPSCVGGVSATDTRIGRISCESKSRTWQVPPVAQLFDIIGPVISVVEHLALDVGVVGCCCPLLIPAVGLVTLSPEEIY